MKKRSVPIWMREELTGWKRWELIWLITACLFILVLSLSWGDGLIGVISAVSGVCCVVCTGKGKLSAYLFGAVNTLLYALIAWQADYYGEVMLNLLYFFPLQFYGFAVWKKNMNHQTKEVQKRRMSLCGLTIMAVTVLILTASYGFLLKYLGGSLPYIDSFSTTVSVVAMIISIRMYSEQWLLWIAVNTVTIFMWGYAFFFQNSESIATLIMWCIYLINAVIMWRKWNREAVGEQKKL